MYMKTNKQRNRKPRCDHNNAPRDIPERKADVFFWKSFPQGNTSDSKSRDRNLTVLNIQNETYTSLMDVKCRSRKDSNDDHLHGTLPC